MIGGAAARAAARSAPGRTGAIAGSPAAAIGHLAGAAGVDGHVAPIWRQRRYYGMPDSWVSLGPKKGGASCR
eukprot:8122387-Lingulodinium_polyedra.AAC.1